MKKYVFFAGALLAFFFWMRGSAPQRGVQPSFLLAATSPSSRSVEKAPVLSATKADEPLAEPFRLALARLPTVSSLRQISAKDVHQTSPVLFRAGQVLGEVEENLLRDPGLAEQTLAFYGICARESGLASSVRALCYHNWKSFAQAGGDLDEIPPSIRKLAQLLD